MDLKGINDRYRHAGGDVAIADTARMFRRTLLRDSDVVGRLGASEFAVVALGVTDDGPPSIPRLAEHLLAEAHRDLLDKKRRRRSRTEVAL